MTATTIVYITLALAVALGFAFFQYLYKSPRRSKDYIFFALRSTSIFLILLLLINPKVRSVSYELIKPKLVLLVDNSESMAMAEDAAELEKDLDLLKGDPEIQQRFDISNFRFGEDLQSGDSLNFSEGFSNPQRAMEQAEDIFQSASGALLLFSDGNQTLGRDYRYFRQRDGMKLFPVVLGDTATYSDLSIERLNVNRYAFLNNRFPVEIFLNYKGTRNVETRLQLFSGNSVVFSKNLDFSEDHTSEIVRAELQAGSVGVKTFRVQVEPLQNEKNVENNQRNFGIEVIDERTNVLILTSMIHPDLGAFKKLIESNQQRKAEIRNISENIQIEDYQLVIIFQPNYSFKDVYQRLAKAGKPYFLVTGSKTDWNFINSLQLGLNKKATGQQQEVFPVFNSQFSTFQLDDIGFGDYPPLSMKFGTLNYDSNFEVILQQSIQGVQTGEPLLAISKTRPKFGFLIGENFWRWRAESYLQNANFELFDEFFGKLIQNLASQEQKQRLEIDYENFYYGNRQIRIMAQYFDENYEFDPSGILEIRLKNKDSVNAVTSSLLLKNNHYEFNAGELAAGTYDFSITEKTSGLSKSGSFQVIDFNPEKQFTSSNLTAMQELASTNHSELYFKDQLSQLKDELLNSSEFTPVQKSHEKAVPLIDWYYLLFVLIAVFAAEWFYRKYLGLI